MKKWLALILLACSGAVFSAAPSAAPAVVYKGEVGQPPVQVALAYLKDKISNSSGQFEYQGLDIKQRSQGEDFSHTQLSVEIKGLMDDSVASERYRFKMAIVDSVWVITAEQKDQRCRRGIKGYTQKLCP
ncbi:hypothetical protein R6242_16720 [Iodobacter sp. CM08]|uniref:hypothetical protein n=1 Tax=Iodobacter sp. CM08 TaxID=3085902 RepID=UPI0029812A38|nr:hypothetical protein [Iodobacter sp. CM08]MDW5418210.1 hypothetical protein [Iodobacter sp. CM08]